VSDRGLKAEAPQFEIRAARNGAVAPRTIATGKADAYQRPRIVHRRASVSSQTDVGDDESA
jgi:hypothetical protein